MRCGGSMPTARRGRTACSRAGAAGRRASESGVGADAGGAHGVQAPRRGAARGGDVRRAGGRDPARGAEPAARRVIDHPDLFDAVPPPAPPPELTELAGHIPPNIKFGTSTWTYDGWKGEVYHREYRGVQPARRLEEYARYPLFGTVGIDSAFYDPPTEEELAAYARHLPPA